MNSELSFDPVTLQDALDDIAATVAWAIDYIEVLVDTEENGRDLSDLPGLRAQLTRLRLIADALVPGRVRDAAAERRWYLAPDDAHDRVRQIEHLLEEAARATTEAFAAQDRAREDAEHKERERADRADREAAERRNHQALVAGHLRDRGPSTLAAIVEGTGLSKWAAEQAAQRVARRGRDHRFVLNEIPDERPKT